MEILKNECLAETINAVIRAIRMDPPESSDTLTNCTVPLKITIPENLDYNDLFDDLFKKYTSSWELVRVRTTNMGTLYELCYDVVLKDETKTKAFMDEIRCRNGNLNITLGRAIEGATL